MREAEWYEPEGEALRCVLCPHRCLIRKGETGRCRARRNENGRLLAESYGKVSSLALDPIEKKPLYHFHPGSRVLSVGLYGCNMRCPFCQNHDISMGTPGTETVTPEQLAAHSLSLSGRGNIGVAYTYNEPLIGYEFVRDTARLVRENGQKNVLVTNGLISEQPLVALLPDIDALNIDLKCFGGEKYRALGGFLPDVLRTIELAHTVCHVEVTALIVPGLNDSPEEMDLLSGWLAALDKGIPLHVTRFFPRHEMSGGEATPAETVRALARRAGARLRNVHVGNC